MLIIDPYKTTFGALISTNKVREQLVKYLSVNNSLSYEYTSNSDAKLAFITGYNHDEKEMPILDHPIVITDLYGVVNVVIDVRKYIKAPDEKVENLEDIVKDKNSLEFLALNGMLIRDFASNDVSTHRGIYKNVASGLASIVTTAVNSVVMLDPVEKASVEIAVTYYANCMTVPDDDLKDMLGSIKARTSKSAYSLKMTNKLVDKTIDALPTEIKDIEDMVTCIQRVLPEGKRELINTDVIVGMLANSWYGPGNGETVIIAMENIPTLMTLLYVNINNKSYKRTQVASVIDKNKRMIGVTVIEKHLSNYLKDNILV